MKIAIIGNGASATNKPNGEFIDGCDIVLRIKNFQIENYEKFVGTKTNWYASKWFAWFDRETFKPLPMKFTKSIDTFLFMFFDPFQPTGALDHPYIQNYHKCQLSNEFPHNMGSPELHNFYVKHFQLEKKDLRFMTAEDIKELAVQELKMDRSIYYAGKHLVEPTVGARAIYKMLKLFPNEEFFISGFDGFLTGWYWNRSHKPNKHHSYWTERLYFTKLIKTKQVTNLDA